MTPDELQFLRNYFDPATAANILRQDEATQQVYLRSIPAYLDQINSAKANRVGGGVATIQDYNTRIDTLAAAEVDARAVEASAQAARDKAAAIAEYSVPAVTTTMAFLSGDTNSSHENRVQEVSMPGPSWLQTAGNVLNAGANVASLFLPGAAGKLLTTGTSIANSLLGGGVMTAGAPVTANAVQRATGGKGGGRFFSVGKPGYVGYTKKNGQQATMRITRNAVIGPKRIPTHKSMVRLRHNLSKHTADARTLLRFTSPNSLRAPRRSGGYRGRRTSRR